MNDADLVARARVALRPGRAGRWAGVVPAFFVLVDERRFSAKQAVDWLVSEGAVLPGEAAAAYQALRHRLLRRRRKEVAP